MELFEQALAFALQAHKGQKRKSSGVPYILHPCEAAAIAASLTDDREVLTAVMLHDTLEDTDATIEEIRDQFGERVAALVQGETENPHPELSREESWMLRKEESLARLREADADVRIMWLSDKLSNLRSLYRLHLQEGDAMWEHFHQKDKAEQERYYRAVINCLSSLSDTVAYTEYIWLLTAVFGGDHEN